MKAKKKKAAKTPPREARSARAPVPRASAAGETGASRKSRLENQALRDSELRYRSIMESRLTGLIFWSLDGAITEANNAFLHMVGYTQDDLREGRINWHEMTPAEFRAVDARAVRELLANGHVSPFEKEYIRKDGTRVPVMMGGALFPHRKNEGVSFVIDITDRKRAERALVESEERYRLLADHTDDIVALNDTQGNRLYLSPSFSRKTGWSAEEMLRADRNARQHPDDAPAIEKARAENIAGKATRIEHRVRCKDGSWLWFDTSCKPIRDAGGKVWRLLVWSHDITEKKQVEADYMRELDFNKALVRHTAALILVTDVRGRIEHANPVFTRVLGYELKDIKGRLAWDIGMMDEQEKELSKERFIRLAAGEDNPPTEIRLRTTKGETRIVEIWGTSSRDHEGRVERVIVTGMDVTEKNQLRNEVIRIAEQEHARIGNDLHDGVGQTMTGIASLLEALEGNIEGPQKVLATRIRELVQESVAEVRRMSHGLSPAGVKNRGLGGGLKLLAETIRTNYRAACDCEIDPGVKIVDAEIETHLFRIAQEAVNNAMRHGKPGLVTITLKRLNPRECALKIEDNGTGFKKSRHADGDGIGVRVMDYRATLIRGVLTIRSRARGGVSVTCTFPYAEQQPANATRAK